MKYRIAFDNHVFRMQKRGGASRYYLELANYLQKSKNFEARILAPLHFSEVLNSDPVFSKRNLYLKHSGNKIGIARFINSLSDSFTGNQINKYEPSLVHETYYKSDVLWNKSIPSVCTILDLTREIIDGNMQKLDRKIQTAERATRIICISENTRRDFLKFAPGLAEKTVVVPLGCSKVFLEEDNSQSGFDKPFILYVGQRGGYKNFSLLLRAISSLNEFRGDFDLIAFGGGKFTKTEKAEIEQLGLTIRVKYAFGDDQTLSTYYKSAVCFVYPSLYEGFGIPILEALASGCRVICSETSSFPEVGLGFVQYFDPRDVQSLCAEITSVFQSQTISEDWKIQAHAHALDFTWEKVGCKTMNEYLKILE
jgi:glycosyltransferase involved in cell wall biosynthesis